MINPQDELLQNFASFIDLSLRAEDSSARNPAFRFPTPRFLVEQLGFPDLELHITEKTIKKIYDFHGVPLSFLKQLPLLLDNENEQFIASIFKSQTQKDSRVVVSFEFVGQKPIIIAIAQNKQVNTNDFVNNIASIYEKDNGLEIFKYWKEKGLQIYQNPHKSLTLPDKKVTIIRRKIRT